MKHAIAIIGAAGAGKTTFLAINYYLFQINSPNGITVEADPAHRDTAKLFHEWESKFNQGDFPRKSQIDPITKLYLNFWKEDIKVSIVDLDPGGEIWDIYNPGLEASTPLTEEMTTYLVSSLGYIVIIDSEKAHKQDSFYKNILINIRDSMPGYSLRNYKPVMLLFTKTDKLEMSNTVNIYEFAKKAMPKTINHYMHFFSSLYDGPLLFGCSIGDVEQVGNEQKISKFTPEGFVEPLLTMFQIIELFDKE